MNVGNKNWSSVGATVHLKVCILSLLVISRVFLTHKSVVKFEFFGKLVIL